MAEKEKIEKGGKAKKPTEDIVTEFKTKLNAYGFIHVSKKALPSLPFKEEQPLIARIEGDALVIRKV